MQYNGELIETCGIKNYNFKTFTWKLIDVCNQRCTYCNEGFGSDQFRPKSSFFSDESQIFAYHNVLKILKLRSLGEFEVDIIGGEPTLHPHICDILNKINAISNCKEISLLTNLKKPIDFFKQLDQKSYDKLLICPSIHFEYYSEELLSKCIEINEFKHIKMIPIVMLHDNQKYWDHMQNFLEGLIENDVEYNISFINSCYDYSVNYSSDFYERFSRYFTHDENRYIFNDRLLLDKYDIHKNDLVKFKGWSCRPLRYVISHSGEISNACTKQRIDFLNSKSFVSCPLDSCDCNVHWNYEKYKQ